VKFSSPRTVAFVDDDAALRAANVQSLELAGFEVWPFSSGAAALGSLDAGFAGVVVTDIRMPGMDGRQLFRRLHQVDADLPVIFITGHADVSEAVESLQEGAYDFVAKPFANERLIQAVTRALETRRLVLNNRRLRAVADEAQAGWPMIGQSPAMESLRKSLRQLAQANVDTIIEGETGVGKELAARALHTWGPRREHPFVALNCGALPAGLVESELFGHELGAFAGAVRTRVGRLEHAHRGTLFLDEIEAMPADTQVKLLRFLAEREVSRLGSNEVRPVDVRIVTASKIDLGAGGGPLRPDVFHRLNVGRVRIPPLRERRSDVPILFAHFVASAADRVRREPPQIDEATQRMLTDHDWPGNVRELSNFAERFVLGLHEDAGAHSPDASGLRERVDRYEADLIRQALARARGNVARTLVALDLPRKTFYDKVKRHGIEVEGYRDPRASASREQDALADTEVGGP
jgi:two-component system C4-dicarboxylate transport response regulator DctD